MLKKGLFFYALGTCSKLFKYSCALRIPSKEIQLDLILDINTRKQIF